MEELDHEVDMNRKIRMIGVKLTLGNAIVALNLCDDKNNDIVNIEWENYYVGRDWKCRRIPENYELIGIMANTKADKKLITRLGFVCRKLPPVKQPEVLKKYLTEDVL